MKTTTAHAIATARYVLEWGCYTRRVAGTIEDARTAAKKLLDASKVHSVRIMDGTPRHGPLGPIAGRAYVETVTRALGAK